jgi:putative ABC transport system permease protein
VLPPAFEAVSGDSVAAESKDSIDQALSFINTFLLVFAAVALVVGSFLIINTFSILVAQRSREMALLRALGASRRQVTRSVLLEALVVGFIGSTVGLLGGFLLAVGLKAIFARVGLDMTGAGLELRPRTVVVSYAVGVIVTLFAAYLPARRASQIAPVAALRDDVALPESTLRRRFITGLAITVIGLALLGVGLFANTSNSLPMVGGGVLGVLVGVSLISPVVGRPLLRLLGFLFSKSFNTVGRLAGQNTLRNPRRTAATASALMIGLALVSAMSIIGASTSSSIDKLIGNEFQSDFVVASSVGSSFSPTIADRIRDIPGVDTAAVFRGLSVKVDGSDTFIGAIDPNEFGKTINVDMRIGRLSDLTDSTVLVERTQASGDGTVVGDHVTVSLPKHDKRLTVAGTYSGSPIVGANYLVTTKTLADGGVAPSDSAVYVLKDPDASTAAVGAAIGKLVKDLPTVELQNQDEFTKQQRGQVDKLLAIIYALLGLAVVIAVLGIVNTLALSVIERTREVGLLRAVGMSRRQLRLLVRLESVAISVLGACLGVLMGVVFGVALQRAVADQGIDVLTIPFGSLALFIVVAAVVGVLAAVLPARRAARLDILRAIHAE